VVLGLNTTEDSIHSKNSSVKSTHPFPLNFKGEDVTIYLKQSKKLHQLAGYLHRLNTTIVMVAKSIHQELGKKYGSCKNAVPYYKYQPSVVLDNQAFTM
jgi:hypothetical protein